jgi:hypothetical protein
VHDLIKPDELLGMRENNASQLLSVYLAIGLENLLTEGFDHLLPDFGVGFIGLMSYLVGINKRGAQSLKDTGYFAFAGANATSQTDHNHINPYFRNN